MAGSELPHKDSPDIYLVPGTPEEHAAQTIANSEEWRGALSLDAYLRREEVLLAQDLTRDGGLTAWVLVYQPAQGGQRQVLCGCESIKKKALMARGGKVDDVITHAIASVFCPPRYRSRGYAGRMMQELGPRLKTWQVEEGKQVPFSVLFSDIGKEFYAARGWQPFPSSHVALPAGVTLHESSLPSVTALRADGQDLAELCAIDERLIRRQLAKSDGSGRLAVAIVPDKVTMDWHHARQDFVATELHGGERPSFLDQGNGAMVEYEDGKRAWIIWQRVWTSPQGESPNTLHIMRLVVEDEDFSDFAAANEEEALKLKSSPLIKGIAALLARAQEVADDSYMKQIDIWNPSSTILAAAKLIIARAAQWHGISPPTAPLAPYPSPESSQNGSPTPHGMDSDKDGPPPAKRRRISRDPKERTTEHLDLRSGSVDPDQQEELDRLLQVLHKRQKIVVIAGAGMSVSAGIPDFRSPDGLFKTLKEEHKIKGSGKDLFDASVYKDDTSTSLFHSMVTSLSRSTRDAKPTAFHHMLATIAKEGRLLRLYSQNVDALDTGLQPLATRIPFTKDEHGKWPATVQLHGSLEKMVCSKCHHLANFDVELFEEAGAMPPLCPECETVNNIRTNNLGKRSHGVGRMRPRMVLYNEQHPDAVAIGSCTSHDLKRRPDAVIVVGTTLKVPGVQRIVQEMCATVRDRKDGGLAIWINQDLPPTFKQFNNCFDIIVQSSCDEVARRAAMRKWFEEPVPDDYSEVSEEDAQKAANRKLQPLVPTPPKPTCPLTAAALAQLPSSAHVNNSFRPPEPDATPVQDPESLRPGNWSPLTNRKASIFESIETGGDVIAVADGMLTPSKSIHGSSRRSTPAKVSNVNEKLMDAAKAKKAAPQKPTATKSKSTKTGQPQKRRNVKFVKAPASKAKAASKAKTGTKAHNAAQPKKNSLTKSQHFTATKSAAVDARSAAKKTLLSPAKSPSGLRNVSNASDMLSSVSERNARVNTSPSEETAFFPNLAPAAENPAPVSKMKLANTGD